MDNDFILHRRGEGEEFQHRNSYINTCIIHADRLMEIKIVEWLSVTGRTGEEATLCAVPQHRRKNTAKQMGSHLHFKYFGKFCQVKAMLVV